MNRLFSYLLILFLTLPFGVKLGMLINYSIQFNYYAETLCENKDKPELQCNGVCQLSKELKSVDDSHSDSETSFPENLKIELLPGVIFSDTHSTVVLSSDESNKLLRSITNLYRYNHATDIFHPPAL